MSCGTTCMEHLDIWWEHCDNMSPATCVPEVVHLSGKSLELKMRFQNFLISGYLNNTMKNLYFCSQLRTCRSFVLSAVSYREEWEREQNKFEENSFTKET